MCKPFHDRKLGSEVYHGRCRRVTTEAAKRESVFSAADQQIVDGTGRIKVTSSETGNRDCTIKKRLLGGGRGCGQSDHYQRRCDYEITETFKIKYPVGLLIRLLEIKPSSYYKWLKRKDTPNRYERFRLELTTFLRQANQQHKTWGYHRLAAFIRSETGLIFSDLLAHKCCKEAGIRSKARPYRYRKTGAEHIRFPNTVKGHWNACEPMSLVVSDMTCVMHKGLR